MVSVTVKLGIVEKVVYCGFVQASLMHAIVTAFAIEKVVNADVENHGLELHVIYLRAITVDCGIK